MPITEVRLPFLHPRVDLTDLHPNHKLLSDLEIVQYVAIFLTLPDGRYRKKDPKITAKHPDFISKYGIIKLGEELFAVYKGKKSNKEIFFSAGKKVKLAQQLLTGAWYALKIITDPMPPLVERVDHSYGVDMVAIKSRYVDIETKEMKSIDSYGGPKLQTKGPLMQRISIIYHRQIPEYSLQKMTHSFLMPLLPGLSLARFLKDNYKLSTYRWLEIALKILREIRENFHKQGLLHRDIKINNLMYNYFKHEVTIIDLEFTRAMNSKRQYLGKLSGTLLYIAPELVKHYRDFYDITNRNDYLYDEYTEAYALGITLKILFNIPVRKAIDFKKIAADEFKKKVLEKDRKKTADEKLDEQLGMYEIGYSKEIKSIAAIRKLLDNLTTSNHEDRNLSMDPPNSYKLLFDHLIDYLEPIQHEILKTAVVNTAIFEMNEFFYFFHTALPLQKERFLLALQQFDEICIVSIGNPNTDSDIQLITIQRILADESLTYKLLCYRNLLVVPDFKSIGEIPAYFQGKEVNQPPRNCTYFYISEKTMPVEYRVLIEKGVNIIIADEKKSDQVFLKEIFDCINPINNADYSYVIRAIEAECQRLAAKYNLVDYRQNEKHRLMVRPSDALARADGRHLMLKNTLESLVKMINVKVSYAAVAMLISILRNDATFSAAPTSFFRKARCVANVDKIQVELECRRAPQRK
jgi:serine/threonine protein kinase